jgi:hypothetical protein
MGMLLLCRASPTPLEGLWKDGPLSMPALLARRPARGIGAAPVRLGGGCGASQACSSVRSRRLPGWSPDGEGRASAAPGEARDDNRRRAR